MNLLIMMPGWLGDVAMAMPTVRALREQYSDARITVLIRPHLRPVVESCPWIDRVITTRLGERDKHGNRQKMSALRLGCRLRGQGRGRFDMAIILPNSFRSALAARVGGIPRRVGYDRDVRRFLLTDRIAPPRDDAGEYIHYSTRDYYLDLAKLVGCVNPDPDLLLFTKPENDARAGVVLAEAGLTDDKPLVLLAPGANFGDAKMYSPDRFTAVGDRCVDELGAFVAVTGAPSEKAILDQVVAAAKQPLVNLQSFDIDLTLLKSIFKRANLLVTNDSGSRHLAISFGVPTVTIFGPTDPDWTELNCPFERKVMVDVDCRPCQQKICPLAGTPQELQCMKLIEVDDVFGEAVELITV